MGTFETNRRNFFGLAGAAAATSLVVPTLAQAATDNSSFGFGPGGSLPLDRIAVQIFTVRTLMDEKSLGLEDTMALLADAGVASIEVGGDYIGRTPQEFRKIVEASGMTIIGNHFGPRTMDGENAWYSDAREAIFEESKVFGLTMTGTGHYYNVPLTVDGFTEFAKNLNIWGEAAKKHGLTFYFHNHDGEFTRFDNKPIYHILLENTDPELVKFELDLGWAAVAGEDVASLVKEHQHRFPYFHVKDLVWREDGVREAKPNTVSNGRKFDFANVGHGEVNWVEIFGALKDVSAHTYIIEHDDAGKTAPAEGSTRKGANPAGAANTIWAGRKHLANLKL